MGSTTRPRGDTKASADAEVPTPPAPVGRRIALWTGAAALGALLAGGAWLTVTGLLARSQLEQVKAEVPQLRQAVLDNRMPEARRLAADIRRHADRAHALTTGPAWWVAGNLPLVGSPISTTRVLTEQAHRLGTDVLPTVVRLADAVSRARTVGSSIDLAPVRRLAPELHHAAVAVAQAQHQVAATSGSWFGPVTGARSAVLHQLTRVAGELSGADRAVGIALPMLGETGPRRYFIGFMNEAEARGTGGILGAFAIATVHGGHVHFDHFGSDVEFQGVRARVALGREYDALYGQDDPAGTYANSDVSPDFRDAGRIWTGLWKAKTGESLDGAIALDPAVLGDVLAVTGPVRTAGGHLITADGVVPLTQRDIYARYGSGSAADDVARKRYVVDLVGAIARDLAGTRDVHGLVRAFSRAAGQRRLLIWSADPVIERRLVDSGWGGALTPRVGALYSGFIVNNAAGNKLDYYLDRHMSYRRIGCGARSHSVATLALTNSAPKAGLPAYVTLRADHPGARVRPGDNRLLVTYYATPGARIDKVELDGRPVPFVRLSEQGLVTATATVDLPVGGTRRFVVDVVEPSTARAVDVLRQPGVRPLAVTVDRPSC